MRIYQTPCAYTYALVAQQREREKERLLNREINIANIGQCSTVVTRALARCACRHVSRPMVGNVRVSVCVCVCMRCCERAARQRKKRAADVNPSQLHRDRDRENFQSTLAIDKRVRASNW